MIEDDFKYADPKKDPRNQPRQESNIAQELEAQGFRPFGYEW